MALPVSVPYAFANATTTQNLSYLDSNFNTLSYTLNGIGNGTVSLANVSITGGTISANVSATSIHNGTSNVSVDSANGPVSINTNGTNAMYIDSSQNVGIGTTSPATLLHVNGASPVLRVSDSVGTGVAQINARNSTASSTWGVDTSIGSITGTANAAYWYNAANTASVFYTNSTERMRIDSSGNVGIGTSSPSSYGKLAVFGTIYTKNTLTIDRYGDATEQLIISNNSGNSIYNATADNHVWQLAGVEKMRLDTSGSLGIGTTSPAAKLNVNGNQLNYGTNPFIALSDVNNSTPSYIQYLTSSNALQLVCAGGANTGYIKFLTGIGNEAARMDASGNLLVGYTSSNGAYKLQVNSQIFATSATIATSDANYKTNVTSLSGALSLVQKLNPVSFNWKKHPVHNFDTETPTVGFLAQEVQTAFADTDYVNSIVKESEVTLPDDTKEKFLGIAEGNMIALLTKAIQELSAEVTALKAKVGQ